MYLEGYVLVPGPLVGVNRATRPARGYQPVRNHGPHARRHPPLHGGRTRAEYPVRSEALAPLPAVPQCTQSAGSGKTAATWWLGFSWGVLVEVATGFEHVCGVMKLRADRTRCWTVIGRHGAGDVSFPVRDLGGDAGWSVASRYVAPAAIRAHSATNTPPGPTNPQHNVNAAQQRSKAHHQHRAHRTGRTITTPFHPARTGLSQISPTERPQTASTVSARTMHDHRKTR